MFATIENIIPAFNQPHVIQTILDHAAWHGEMEGLKAEKLVRGQKPFTYLLRQGEPSNDAVWNYYVTFVLADGTVRHQPFAITMIPGGWRAENFGGHDREEHLGIESALHGIMHCEEEQLIALHS